MAQQHIGVGTVANDGTGDPLRTAMTKAEANFTELYTSDALKAPLASPALTGTPTAPTAAPGTNTTQIATTAFVTAIVTGLWKLKGGTDCSANPNYPAATKGDAYVVTVAGKIGGASGVIVDIGDVFIASADNAGGTQSSVGTSWFTIEHNLTGALLAANNLSDVANAATARTNLGLAIGTNVQAYDADLTIYAGITPSANVQSLLAAANFAAISTLLGLNPTGASTIAPGAGSGTGPTIAITNGPNGGRITLTTGSSPTLNGVIATITYVNAFPADSFVVISAANANAGGQIRQVFADGMSGGFVLTNVTSALTASTQYIWDFYVTGK